MFDKKRLIEILNEFPKKKIVVIGDLMLDEYIIGSVTRISPEAPVPVVNVKKESFVLGGAANVVNNLSSLGVKVLAFGVIGNDNNGKKMLAEFEKKDVSTEYINILTDRPTIMKQRILANNQQLLRLDWEKKHPINSIEEDFIIDNLKRIINEVDGVILSDYDKGVLTERVAKEVINLAKEMSAATKRGQDLGLNDNEIAFYDALAANESAVKAMGNDEENEAGKQK